MRRLLAITVLLVVPVIATCAEASVVSPSGRPPTTSPSAAAPSSSATQASMGRLPDDCEPGPDPVLVSDHVGHGIGADPAWAIGFGDDGTLGFTRDDPNQGHGWLRKVLWLVRRTTTDPITVTGHRIDDDAPVWFAYPGPDAQVTSLVLDPSSPDGEQGDWLEYRGYFVVPAAGCYRLEADIPGRGWEVAFSAGLDATPG